MTPAGVNAMYMGFLGKTRKKGEEINRGRGNERGKEKRGKMKQNGTKKISQCL